MILCCGEALIDLIPTELDNGETAFVPHTGGAVFNTSIALGRLGVETALLSGVSTEPFGQSIARELEANNVSSNFLVRSDNPTTIALLQVQNGSASYSFYDDSSAGRNVTDAQIPALSGEIDTVFFGGISLVNNPAADTYAGVLKQLAAGRISMIDPNIRPAFIDDESAYRERLNRMLGFCDIVKVSDEDLQWIAGPGISEAEQVQCVRDLGPRIVMVTKGEQGAVAFFRDDRVVVTSTPTIVEDTVGAGDTFNAGFLSGLRQMGVKSKPQLETLTLDQLYSAVDLGTKVASITVSRKGAQPPWANELT